MILRHLKILGHVCLCLLALHLAVQPLASFFLADAHSISGHLLRAPHRNEAPADQVRCTCTCCGDVCPMGAACCCAAEKVPIRAGGGPFLAGAGCADRDAALAISFHVTVAAPPLSILTHAAWQTGMLIYPPGGLIIQSSYPAVESPPPEYLHV